MGNLIEDTKTFEELSCSVSRGVLMLQTRYFPFLFILERSSPPRDCKWSSFILSLAREPVVLLPSPCHVLCLLCLREYLKDRRALQTRLASYHQLEEEDASPPLPIRVAVSSVVARFSFPRRPRAHPFLPPQVSCPTGNYRLTAHLPVPEFLNRDPPSQLSVLRGTDKGQLTATTTQSAGKWQLCCSPGCR